MIRAQALLNDKHQIVIYKCLGHAAEEDSDKKLKERDYLAVCNAVSALQYQFLFGIKKIFGSSSIKKNLINPGHFEIELEVNSKGNNLSLLSKYFLIGLQLIEKNHPHHFELTIKDN